MPTGTKIEWKSATLLVVANMIGTGVFTSLGYQLVMLHNTWSILLLWCLGGILALCGAFSYAELGAFYSRSGGEYYYLNKLFHPIVGYLSGWVSITVGFAAPVALSAMAIGANVHSFLGISSEVIAVFVVLAVTIAHSFSVQKSNLFQTMVTVLKIALVLIFVFASSWGTHSVHALNWSASWQTEILTPSFAVSFVFVTYSYSGWNAAAYIVEEIRAPETNLPKGLIYGTSIVMVLYLALQLVFLNGASMSELSGHLEIVQIVATNLFGNLVGGLVSVAIALLLISSISAMVWVGPRVGKSMARDYRLWHFLQKTNAANVPIHAIWFQSLLSIFMILTSTFEQVLLYCGFVLQFFSAMTVVGGMFLRFRNPHLPYKSPLFPLPSLFFVTLSAWILFYLVYSQPMETAIGLGILLVGLVSYFIPFGVKAPHFPP